MRRALAAITVLAIFLIGAKGQTSSAPTNGIVVEPKPLSIEKLELFPFDSNLEKRIAFWVDIYSKYNSWQSVVHDKIFPHIIYGVAESANIEKRPAFFKTNAIQKTAQEILLRLHNNRAKIAKDQFVLKAEEKRIYDLFQNIPGDNKFLLAADSKRFRRQGGLKDSLLKALHLSGRYLPRMEKLLQREGLPIEIAYLPFVESSFNEDAISKVGASGIWQLMPETGKEFLRIDEAVDERNDPMRAAAAAATLLKQNFEALRTWPLAITAYNHGKLGMTRAVKASGTTDISKIIATYDGPNFGFASSNFYASFLAAKHVAKNHEYYLGKVEKARILEFDEFVVPDYVEMKDLANYIKVTIEQLKELNPGLTNGVWTGQYYVPVGYNLRLPMAGRDLFLSLYERIPKYLKHDKQKGPPELLGSPQISKLD
jgi:membrane-bound lytic murein transglycosylase D